MFTLRNASTTTWRVGIAVTRKTGGAVIRNRVKRVVREFFRLHGNELLDSGMMQDLDSQRGETGLDLVVTVRRGIAPGLLNLGLVERELAPLLRQSARPGAARS